MHIESFPREGEPLIAPGGALAEPGVTDNKKSRPGRGARKLIEKSFQKRLYDYMGGVVKEHKGHLLEIGGIANHVHLLVSLSNLNSYSGLIRDVNFKAFLRPCRGAIFCYLLPRVPLALHPGLCPKLT